ncbi:MAG: twin arginine-targeting protein translocase TatC [Porphyromonadaceae bacterium CG2_30_38_12]|nr:MAG: twin arginine-targeting protein translocase TatC [Porphyromonadaceae bacterium CG2_30_38_12]
MSFFETNEGGLTFWDHLEALRWTIFRVLIVLIVVVSILFGFSDFLFNKVIFPPLSSDFVFYKLLCHLSIWLHTPALCPDDFKIQLVNLTLSGQFMAQINTVLTVSIVVIVPYLLFEIWKFVKPALYANERKNIGSIFFASSFLFYLGTLVSYYLIFPLTIRFLGTYQVSELIPNQISLESYMGTLFVLTFALGVMFEMPILAFFLSKLGIISRETLRNGRNIAIVVILIVSAVITPTTDPFTMLAVALPLQLLYEISILVCKPRKVVLDDVEEE